jgi:hypothetical protein
MGVGFTGSLASSRPKHGDHRYALLISSPLHQPRTVVMLENLT